MISSACTCQPAAVRVEVAGVPIDPLSAEAVLDSLDDFLQCRGCHVVNFVPAHPIVEASRDSALRGALAAGDLNLPDGVGVVWGLRLLGQHEVRERVYGPDLMVAACRWGLSRGLSHAFVGGTQETLAELTTRLQQQDPGLVVSGAYAAPFRAVTPEGVEDDLRKLDGSPDIIWVGLGTPKQQIWAEMAREFRPAKIIATVGAAFDFLSGAKPMAPSWMQSAGLEWAFRLASEPRRLWRRYLLGNPRFALAILRQRAREVMPR